jgi:dipeptidase E
MLSQPETAREIIALSGLTKPDVLYLGTATYDAADAQMAQTGQFSTLGCRVEALRIAYLSPPRAELENAFAQADVVVVSGGNTLFAVDRFRKLGIDKLIRAASARGAVLAGGSAGGIIWFDGGHSDSMDATTYKNPPGPLLSKTLTKRQLEQSWAYIRVPGLGMLPGLFCPHYDVTEGNGVLRADSFLATMRHNAGENAVAVDNWAAIIVDGDEYRVTSRANRTGSVGPDGHFTANFSQGRPGAWAMAISATDGALKRTLVPEKGRVADLFRAARYVVESAMLKVARMQNPDDGVKPTVLKDELRAAVGLKVG